MLKLKYAVNMQLITDFYDKTEKCQFMTICKLGQMSHLNPGQTRETFTRNNLKTTAKMHIGT